MAMSRRIFQAAFAIACGAALLSVTVSSAERKPAKLKYGEFNPADKTVEQVRPIRDELEERPRSGQRPTGW